MVVHIQSSRNFLVVVNLIGEEDLLSLSFGRVEVFIISLKKLLLA